MAALVSPGAPVSVLIDYGLAEAMVEQLVEGGVGTIEKLGAMTPEQLEEIQGIGAEAVEQIQDAVNGYYGQFECTGQDNPEETAGADAAAPDRARRQTKRPKCRERRRRSWSRNPDAGMPDEAVRRRRSESALIRCESRRRRGLDPEPSEDGRGTRRGTVWYDR